MTNNILVSNDSISMVVNDVLSEQYEQSLKLDTLLSRVDSIKDMTEQLGQSTQLDTILSRIETIMRYGVGYHDATEHIALPLLIALFAFSFTFLFSAINHINDKYNSSRLSVEFSNSFQYFFYWFCTIIAVAFLLVYGYLSLFSKGSTHYWTKLLLTVALLYSVAIVWFVYYCIQFNKPSWLLQRDKIKKDISWKPWVASSNKLLMNTRLIMGKSVNTIDPDLYGNVLDIYRYALNNNDMKLFDEVMDYMGKLSEAEIKTLSHNSIGNYLYTCYSLLLFDNAFSIYASTPNNLHVESLLVRNKLNCFSHRHLVETIDMAQMMKMADYGHISMMDKYLELSRDAFNFIKTIPQMMYVQGRSINEIANSEIESRKSWDNVCCDYYVLTAYWFAMGQYSFLYTLTNNMKYSFDNIFPNSYYSIISLYAKCIQNNSRLEIYDLIEGVKKVVNTDMVKRYTAALLMLTNDYVHNMPLVRKEFEAFKKEKDSFVDCCEELKKDDAFTNQFPHIKNVDSQKLIEKCNNAVDPNNYYFLFNCKSVDKQMIQSLQHKFNTMDVVSEAKGNHSNLWGNMKDGFDQCVVFGELSIHERILVDLSVYSIMNSIKSHALYLMLSAYKNMQVHTRKTSKDGLERCLKKITKGKFDDYMIINLDSQFSLIFNPIANRYLTFDSYSWPLEVKESFLYDDLQGGLLVIEKKYRPFLTTDGNRPELDHLNKSSFKDGRLDHMITFNPHLVVKYNKDAVIYRIIEK